MKRIFIAFVCAVCPSLGLAQLISLDDEQLQQSHGFVGHGVVFSQARSLPSFELSSSHARNGKPSSSVPADLLTGLDKGGLSLTQGLEIDLEIQASLDMAWLDSDGFSGNAGFLKLSGIHLGGHKGAITSDMLKSERPFRDDELALINNLIIDFDSQKGMFITLEEIGDRYGNGLDIIVNDIFLGNEQRSAGGLLIENVSNFIQDSHLARFNETFGMSLATLDDGKNTANGNWFELNAIVLTEEGSDDLGVGLPTSDIGIPGLKTNTTIDASFVLHVDKLAWVDDGKEFGIAGLMIYDGLDTNGDGVDDTVGPAKLTQMKIETVDHRNIAGEPVKALHIANLDFKADIAMQSIYVGDPLTGSLGSLHIKGLDTSGTALWIYGH